MRFLRVEAFVGRYRKSRSGDDEWDRAKEKFNWGEIILVYDEGVAEYLEPFSDKLHSIKTKEEKEQLAKLVPSILEACRISLGEDWDVEHLLAARKGVK